MLEKAPSMVTSLGVMTSLMMVPRLAGDLLMDALLCDVCGQLLVLCL